MKIKVIGLFCIVLLSFVSCKKDAEETEEVYEPYFKEDMVSLYTGESKDIELLNADEVTFSVTNDTICEVISTNKNICRVGALKAGATVLKAVYNDVLYRCVLNVTYKEEEETSARSVYLDDGWFLCTFTYEKDGIYATECFCKKGIPEIEINDGNVYVMKENGKILSCLLENFISFTYD